MGKRATTPEETAWLQDRIPAYRSARNEKTVKHFLMATACSFTKKFPDGRIRILRSRGVVVEDMLTHLSDGDTPGREERITGDAMFRSVSTVSHTNLN